MKALYPFAYTLFSAILNTFFRLRVYGREHLPRGKTIVAANHQSYVDPTVIGPAIPMEIWYLARQDVFKFTPFRWLCVKVNTILIKKRRAHRISFWKSMNYLMRNVQTNSQRPVTRIGSRRYRPKRLACR